MSKVLFSSLFQDSEDALGLPWYASNESDVNYPITISPTTISPTISPTTINPHPYISIGPLETKL